MDLKRWLWLGSLLLILSGCNATGTNDGTPVQPTPTAEVTPTKEVDSGEATKEPTVSEQLTKEEVTNKALVALKNKDHAALQKLIHPKQGVLFSPYVYIDKETALTFQANELPTFADKKVWEWGVQDGSGEPIKLSFADYYERYLFNHDFTTAEEVKADEVIMPGNMIVNIKEVFPNAAFYDYHFSGFDEQFAGIDWASLIVVMEQYEEEWYVVALVHSEWTV